MADKKQKDPNKGGVNSPSSREQTVSNCDGMPPKKTAEDILNSNTPPKRYASDSTAGLGKS